MNDDLISRQTVLKIIDGWYDNNRDAENIEDLIVLITYMDPVNPQKPKTGHWIAEENEEMETIGYYCSECDLPMETENQTRFCPNCGAKMSEIPTGSESNRTCHTCKHYTSGEHDGSCGSYICKGYSNWESEEE